MRSNDEIINVLTDLKDQQQISISELARNVGMAKSALSRYFNKTREFPLNRVDDFAKALHTTPEHILGFSESDMIATIYDQLEKPRQQIVYNCAKEQLDEQNHPNVHNIEESKQTYTIDVLGAVSAGTGEWLDGQQPEPVTVEGPLPHYDFAVRVNGISMTPTFSDGEILFVDKVESASDVRNNQFVIAEINGNAYVKKLFVSSEGVRLISLNKDYEDIIIHDYDDYRIVGTVVI